MLKNIVVQGRKGGILSRLILTYDLLTMNDLINGQYPFFLCTCTFKKTSKLKVKMINQRKVKITCSNCNRGKTRTLPHGYYVCDKCCGDGHGEKDENNRCSKCKGRGLISWTDKIRI